MIDGIKHEKISDKEYELRLFEYYEFHDNKHTFTIPDNSQKTINTGLLPLDSGVERQFAQDCESREDIEFYFKLPSWFKIKTPIGNYNPDWALVKKGSKKVYFVAETKSDDQELRPSEDNKIKCGQAHYEILDDVEFKQVSKVRELDLNPNYRQEDGDKNSGRRRGSGSY